MASNPLNMKPTELIRLMNRAGFGTVLNESRLKTHRLNDINTADHKGIDLLKYAGWLTLEYFRNDVDGSDYLERRRRQTERNAEAVRAAQDIGKLPEVGDVARKEAALKSFQTFCETYFREVFYLPWSQDHLHVISKIERAVAKGGLFALAMPRGSGKALALDTPIPTPQGWSSMGELRIGDTVFDDSGNPCQVMFATGVQRGRECFAVTFSDGERIVCDADHLWTVHDRYSRRNSSTLTTKEMVPRVTLPSNRGRKECRYRISLALPLQLPEADLPFDPYSFGVWLGDGACRSSLVTLNGNDAPEICRYIGQSNETVVPRIAPSDKGNSLNVALTRTYSKKTSFQARLREYHLLKDKHIPAKYLRASESQRFSLPQGIMDTDGYVDSLGHCEIVIKYPRFADSFGELLAGLGIKHGRGEKWVTSDEGIYGPYHRFHFVVHEDTPVFRLQRKRERLRPRPSIHPMSKGRMIESILPVPSVPVRCIQVDSPSRLYLAGRKMVPTHNTVLCQTAVVWAALSGATPFVCLIAASAERGKDLLETIKTWLETNPLLQADFPEVCFPIQCLERIANRQKGQKHHGEPTRIEWGADRIILPTITGSAASGVVISCSGMRGSEIRGQNYARPDGKVVRPRLVLIDDPQTTESAWSPSQSQRRESILAGDVLGMAGPGKKIAGLMACTVIRPEDMAHNILNREKHPEWQGERTKMVYSFPANEKLWTQYTDLRRDSFRNDGDGKIATEFYIGNREAMDAGAKVAWPERFNPDEVSAIQHAMNLKIRDESAFFAEYQNEPIIPSVGEEMLTAEEIASKTNGYERGIVPLDCHHLTMFIDIHQTLLYWIVVAWDRHFSGYVLDYGTFPDQRRPYFLMKDAHRTLQQKYKSGGLEGAIYAGLEALCEERFSRAYDREDGLPMTVSRALIDANWGQTTDVIYQFCRQSKHAALLFPSHGKYVGASGVPFSEYRHQRGDRVGLHWRMPNLSGKRQVRHVLIDTNYWKSFVYSRLAVMMGDPGSLSLFGHDPKVHQMLSEHLTAEYRIKTLANGRTVDEWKLRAARPDNHWFDCLVGAAVAASIEGVELKTLATQQAPKRPRIKLSELRRRVGSG